MTLPTRNTKPLDARTLLGAGLGGAIESVLQCMELAEEEIAAAKGAHPLAADLTHRAFAIMCPSAVLRDGGEKLYRAHCRELLERVHLEKDTRPGTTAEVVAVLSTISFRAPLDRHATVLYWQLFEELFPGEAERIRGEAGAYSADAFDREQARVLEEKLRRKLRVASRVLDSSPRRSKAA